MIYYDKFWLISCTEKYRSLESKDCRLRINSFVFFHVYVLIYEEDDWSSTTSFEKGSGFTYVE